MKEDAVGDLREYEIIFAGEARVRVTRFADESMMVFEVWLTDPPGYPNTWVYSGPLRPTFMQFSQREYVNETQDLVGDNS